MRHLSPILFLGILALTAPGLRAQSTLELSDRGQLRRFELADDEVYTIGADGARRLERLAARANAAELRTEARRLGRVRRGRAELVLYEAGRPRTVFTRRLVTPRVLAVLDEGTDPTAVGVELGAARLQAAPGVPGGWLFEAADSAAALDLAAALRTRAGVRQVEPQLARQQQKRRAPSDPLFTNQWHLLNRGQGGGYATVDIDVTNVWDTYRGEDMTIAIVDDGLEATHPDLTNADTSLDHDFVDGDDDASPGPFDDHGTACAGVAAAVGSNGVGVVGAAYRAALVGLRLISEPSTDEEEAAALGYSNQIIQIKSSSWGPVDDGITLEGPGSLTEAALRDGARYGRGGKGTIYTWAGGNGREAFDNVNKDGYANSIYTLAIAAISDQGFQTFYSEPGACLVVSTPSNDDLPRQGITTTDRTGASGYNTNGSGEYADLDYTKTFGGTSSSAPLAAGAIALLLQAQPNLGWRDVQEILLRTAFKNHASDTTNWVNNGAGIHFNHKYGAGLLKTRAAIALASMWTNLSVQTSIAAEQTNLAVAIPDNSAGGVTRTFALSNVTLRTEHVVVTLDVDHTYRGDLEVILTAPSGMQSRLMEVSDDWNNDYHYWRFMTVRDWGESSAGTWSVKVADRVAGDTGLLRYARIEVFGTAASNSLPYFVAITNGIDDATDGNGNGAIDPGETLRLYVPILNIAGLATGVTATLSTTSSVPVLLVATTDYANAATQATVTNAAPFVFRIPKSASCGSVLAFQHRVTSRGRVFTNFFNCVIGATMAGAPVTNAFESATVPRFITNGVAVYLTNVISLAGAPVLDDVDTAIRINHTFVGDLDIELQHPDGTAVVLANNENGATNFGSGAICASAVRTVFDDEAGVAIQDGTEPFAGSYRPQRQLSALDGRTLNGTWRLKISDEYEGDVGTALCWSVTTVTHTNGYACTLFNHAPAASNMVEATAPLAPTNLLLRGGDLDGELLTFRTNSPPAHGTLSGLATNSGAVTYTPAAGFCGTDTFTFVVNDGFTDSAPATVTLAVGCTADRDEDGIYDVWESAWFTNLATATTNSDFDGDGFPDTAEFRAGTLPTVATSFLAVALAPVDELGPRVVQWASVSNRSYALLSATNAGAGFGGAASNLPATPPLNTYTDAAPDEDGLRFYRLRVE